MSKHRAASDVQRTRIRMGQLSGGAPFATANSDRVRKWRSVVHVLPVVALLTATGRPAEAGWRLYSMGFGSGSQIQYTYTPYTQFSGVRFSPDRGVVYQGGAQEGCLVYGPHMTLPWRTRRLIGEIDIDFHWVPDTYRVCNHRDWMGRCDGWDTAYRDFGLSVDMTTNEGAVTLARQSFFKVKDKNGGGDVGPNVYFEVAYDGFPEKVELRVCGVIGGREVFVNVLSMVLRSEVDIPDMFIDGGSQAMKAAETRLGGMQDWLAFWSGRANRDEP